MATYYSYICKKCGKRVTAATSQSYPLFIGVVYSYHCSNCKKVIELTDREINDCKGKLCCTECNSEGTLSPWSPSRGGCPECGGRLIRDKDTPILMAD